MDRPCAPASDLHPLPVASQPQLLARLFIMSALRWLYLNHLSCPFSYLSPALQSVRSRQRRQDAVCPRSQLLPSCLHAKPASYSFRMFPFDSCRSFLCRTPCTVIQASLASFVTDSAEPCIFPSRGSAHLMLMPPANVCTPLSCDKPFLCLLPLPV